MTKERLRKYGEVKKELEQIRQKLQAVKAALYAPGAPRLTGMPKSGGGNPLEMRSEKHLALLELYDTKAAELAGELMAIEQEIAALEPKERTLMRCRYIDGLSWDDVAEKIGYCWAQTHRLHAQALRKLKEPGD